MTYLRCCTSRGHYNNWSVVPVVWLGCYACFRNNPLQIDSDTVTTSNHVRVLGVILSTDLSLDKHVSSICASCFFWLRQLRRVRRSLDDESVKTLVHAFVTARVDYCNMVLASSPRSVTDKLQRVLNAAARLVSGTRKYDRGLSQILHADLHWLDVADRVRYLSLIHISEPTRPY